MLDEAGNVSLLHRQIRGSSLGRSQSPVVGCVIAGSGDQKLFADGQHEYVLTAETTALEESLKATDNKQMRLRGFVDDSAGLQPTFEVTQVLGMVERPKPKISPGWADAAKWQTKRNRHYGVEFKHPAESPVVENSQAGVTLEETNFVAADGTIPLGGFPIPRETYPDSNFVGGGFALSVNPEITNRASCEQFGDFDPRSFSTRKIRHVRYTEMESGDAAMGTGYERQYFHSSKRPVLRICVRSRAICHSQRGRWVHDLGAARRGCDRPRGADSGESFLSPRGGQTEGAAEKENEAERGFVHGFIEHGR